MIANAAPWSYALKQQYVADFPPESLFEVYGSTELGVDTVLLPEDQLRKPGSCGKPAPGIEIKLFGDDGTESPAPGRSSGELFVRSGVVIDGYYKNDASYAAEQPRRLQTVGDIAYWDDEGYVYICDRKKDMIISGGMNIYPAEIEAVLEQHPEISRPRCSASRRRSGARSCTPPSCGRGRRGVADRRGGHGVRARAPGQLQGAALGGLRRRAAAHRLGQGAEARAAGAVLGRPRCPGGVAPGPGTAR